VKAMAFVDYENIWVGLAERGCKLTSEQLVQFLQQYAVRSELDLLAIYLYANFDREEFWREQTSFEKINIFTRHVYGKNNYANTELRQNAADLELMLEAQEILLTRSSTVDVFILITGDGDFLPLVRKIRAWGKEVKVIGVAGSVHRDLQIYCDKGDVLGDMLNLGLEHEYDPSVDVVRGIETLGQLQIRMPYVASTKARMGLSQQLSRSMSEIKELVRYMLRESIISEREYPDASLKIGRTKIYILNLNNVRVQEALGSKIGDVQQRCLRLDAGDSDLTT